MTNEERLKGRWGADRMEADAFIMTQLTQNERALQELKALLLVFGLGTLAYVEGYHWGAYAAGAFGFLAVVSQEVDHKKRQASITRLMDRNWDSED